MNRDDFSLLNDNVIYFDNAATSLKPKIISEVTSDYYNHYSVNIHRGDYDLSYKVDSLYEKTRTTIKKFINAKHDEEIIFTYGTTDSLNKLVFGYFKNMLKQDDEVLITKSEHASNVLPWFELQETHGIKVNYIPLDDNYEVIMDNVKKSITSKTKVISLAYITNVVGDVRPLKEIIEYAHSRDIIVVVDGAQAIAHINVDVQALDIDFLAFSGHKMLGPTGIGVLYGKMDLLSSVHPTTVGGGMNASFNSDGIRIYDELPELLEAGTPNIAGVLGLCKAVEYLNDIGIGNIIIYEEELRKYAIDKLQSVPNIIIYNEHAKSSIITINIKDIFAQDLAIYLNKYGICVRAGNHCAKILKDEMGIKNTCRISLSFYNTKEEIDKLIIALKNPNIMNEII